METRILTILLIVLLANEHHAIVIRLQKTVCTTVDANFSRFDLCEVKNNEQKIPSLFTTLILLDGPIADCIINTEFYHVMAKNQLLLSNRTWDACELLQSKNKRKNAPAQFVLNILKEYTDMNHSCPIQDAIHMRNFAPKKFTFLAPHGDYLFKMKFNIKGRKRFTLDLHMRVVG